QVFRQLSAGRYSVLPETGIERGGKSGQTFVVLEDGRFNQVIGVDLEEFFSLLDLGLQQVPVDGALVDVEQGDVVVKDLVEQNDELHQVGVGLLPEGLLPPAEEVGQ